MSALTLRTTAYSVTKTGVNGTSGTSIITVPDNLGIALGQSVTGTGIGVGATVQVINGTAITLSVVNSGTVSSATITFAETNQGSPLTNAQVDSNFIELRRAIAATIENDRTNSATLTNKTLSSNTSITAGNISNVAITGSTINSSIIGGTTPAAGTFSTLSSPSVALTGGSINGVTIGATTAANGTFATLTAAAINGPVSGSGASITSLNADNITSGTVVVSRGGTGLNTLGAGHVLIGNGTSAINTVAPGTLGQVLTSTGTGWQSQALPAGATGQTAESTSTGYLNYSGTATTAGQLNGNTTTAPTGTKRLNYEGNFYATAFYGDGTNLTNVAPSITDDTTTNSNNFYLLFDNITTGRASSINVSSSKLYFNPSTGTLNTTNYNSLSDLRLKQHIETIENGVDTINKLDGVSFVWKETQQKSYGVIAQEIENVLPELVSGDDIKTVNYSGIIAFLINAVKELDARVKALENK